MTWEEKFAALQALGPSREVCLMMREPGNWHVSASLSTHDDMFERGVTVSEPTPEAAVNAYWRRLVDDLPTNEVVGVYRGSDGYKFYRWMGFMWREVDRTAICGR